MPGIIGHTGKPDRKRLEKGLSLLRYAADYINDPIFCDERIACGRTHLGVVGDSSSPSRKANLYAWVEGEWYNTEDLDRRFGSAGSSLGSRLLDLYQQDRLNEYLAQVDGLYVALIYDADQKKVLLISDRLGLKPLYYWKEHPHFGWCSELKGFLQLPSFPAQMDEEAISCFMQLGYIAGDRTWFQRVWQVPAATVLTYAIEENRIVEERRYWEWSSIQKHALPFDQAKESLAHLIRKAVQKRLSQKGNKPVGISLSGGLDSRLILACLNPKEQPVAAFTFGKKDSWDQRIARRVSQDAGIDHIELDLHEANWLQGKWESIWKADAMSSMAHLHLSPFHEALDPRIDINLNGFLGDLTLKGFYVPLGPDTRIDEALARKQTGDFVHFDPPEDPFYDFPALDPYFINNGQRKKTMAASVEWSKHAEQRNPWADNDLLEFLYSLPDAYRLYHRIYIATLNDHFPDLFRDIPWQRIGISIRHQALARFLLRIRWYGILRRLPWLTKYDDTPYKNWLRTPPAAKEVAPLLRREHSLYKNYLEDDLYEKHWRPHQAQKADHTEMILRAATLEYWLQCIQKISNPQA